MQHGYKKSDLIVLMMSFLCMTTFYPTPQLIYRAFFQEGENSKFTLEVRAILLKLLYISSFFIIGMWSQTIENISQRPPNSQTDLRHFIGQLDALIQHRLHQIRILAVVQRNRIVIETGAPTQILSTSFSS